MPNWHSLAEIVRDEAIFVNLIHIFFGLYLWEFALSFNFDVAYLSGKRSFRWPMIFYFAGRYCLLFSLIGVIIGLDVRSKMDCQALFTFNQLSGMASVGFASINLSIRTMAVWLHNKYVVALLVVIILGHWSLILQGVLLNTVWTPNGCMVRRAETRVLAATFIYSMAFDAIVIGLMASRFWMMAYGWASNVDRDVEMGKRASSCRTQGKGAEGDASVSATTDVVVHVSFSGPGRLGRLVFGDGMIYFVISFVANLLATVFMLINLNAVMSIVFNVPAAIACTIAASRAVRRLSTFATQGDLFCAPPTSHLYTHEPIVFRSSSPSSLAAEEPGRLSTRIERPRKACALTRPSDVRQVQLHYGFDTPELDLDADGDEELGAELDLDTEIYGFSVPSTDLTKSALIKGDICHDDPPQ